MVQENSSKAVKGFAKKRLLESTSLFVVNTFENIFYKWGTFVASNPIKVIIFSILLTGVCSVGFLKFYSEADVQKLYLPPDHIYLQNKEWRQENFKDIGRGHFALITHEENVLTPDGLIKILELHNRVRNVEMEGKKYKDICLDIPITDILLGSRRRRRQAGDEPSAPLTIDYDRLDNGTTTTTASTTTTTKSSPTTTSASGPSDDAYEYFNFYTNEKVEDSPEEKAADEGDGDDYYGGDFGFTYDYEGSDKNTGSSSSSKKDDEDDDDYDLADELPADVYCDIVDTLNDKCGEYSLLEIWKYDEEVIRGLSQQDIIDAINTVKESPIFGYETNYTDYLGGKVKNATGHVIAATAARSIFLATYDADNIAASKKKYGFEFDIADPFTMEWEGILVKTLENIRTELQTGGEGYGFFFRTARSFADEGSKPVEFDFMKMIGGYILMFLYVSVLLGNTNFVEHRFYLACVGLLCVGFGIIIALGLTSALGYFYTPLHGVLPFLCLGIGIDGMFVIIRCYTNIPEEERLTNPLVKNMALTMKHAGVSITVTILTDVVAFAVGSVAVLPCLKAFCVSSAIAVAAIYTLQLTWFVAFVTLDQKRIEAKRDGLFLCFVHKNWTPSGWSQKDWGKVVCTKISKLLEYKVYKATILGITAAIFAGGLYGTLQIKIDFDPVAVLPPRSNLKLFIDESNDQYPTNGYGAFVYTGAFNYTLPHFESIEKMVTTLDNMAHEKEIISYGEKLALLSGSWDLSTGFWWVDLKDFMLKKRNVTDWRQAVEDGSIRLHLSDYLHREEGAQDKINFEFDGELECNVPAPLIKATKLGSITFNEFQGPSEHIPAKDMVDKIIEEAGMPSYSFSDSTVYISWETDRIIGAELWRNMSMCLACVFLITLVMLADIRICFFVMTCVLFTMVAVTGGLYYWNQAIDAFVCIHLVICIGLCVDYSAHIAHAFIVGEGTSTQRAAHGFSEMGPAIFHGGTTTFVALSFLGFSESMVFIVFFKVFVLTVIIGLFHGLIYLPVALAVFGSNRVTKVEPEGFNKESANEKKNGISNPEFVYGEPPE